MENKLRLIVVEPHNSGGLIHYTYQLCTAMADEGVDVTLITATDYELADLPHNFRVEGMLHLWQHFDQKSMKISQQGKWARRWRKIYWTLRRGVRAIRLISAWVRLTNYLLRERPDIIQFTRLGFSFEAFFINILHRNGLKLTQICHEFEYREPEDRLSSLLFAVNGDVYRRFSAIIFLAEESRNRFLTLFPCVSRERTHVAPHGNSGRLLKLNSGAHTLEALRKQYDLNENDRVVLFFGLLSPSKGIEDLVDAFAIARQSCSAKLVIAGYPTKHIDMTALREKILLSNLKDDVVIDARYIPNEQLEALMGLATVVVYPYRSGTQSGALQVAYTFGRPVIATTIGGLPEAVDDGKSGYLVPSQAPRELADKIITMINNPEMAAKMGEYARHLSETRFSWESIAKQIVQIYCRLLAQASPKIN